MMIETVTNWLRPTRSQPPAHVTTVVNARLYNRLHHLGVETVTDLLRMTEDDLLDMRNVGVKTVRDTQSELQRQGLPALEPGSFGGMNRSPHLRDNAPGHYKGYR